MQRNEQEWWVSVFGRSCRKLAGNHQQRDGEGLYFKCFT